MLFWIFEFPEDIFLKVIVFILDIVHKVHDARSWRSFLWVKIDFSFRFRSHF